MPDKEPFQFNKPVGETLGKSEQEIPEHIQGVDFLSPTTKAGLAQLEKAARQMKESDGEPVPNEQPVVQEDTLSPPAPSQEVGPRDEETYLDFLSEGGQDILNNPELRKDIESRCRALSIDELLVDGRCRQPVPIVPGSFEVVFQTMTGEEDLFIKELISQDRGSEMYIQQKYATMNLTLGLQSINGEPLPSCYVGDSIDKKAFMERFAWVQKLPTSMLVSLHVNHYWFDQRSRKIFSFRGSK